MFYHLHLGARLFLFGSSKNGFGFRTSDIDICMTFDDVAKEEVNNSMSTPVLLWVFRFLLTLILSLIL